MKQVTTNLLLCILVICMKTKNDRGDYRSIPDTKKKAFFNRDTRRDNTADNFRNRQLSSRCQSISCSERHPRNVCQSMDFGNVYRDFSEGSGSSIRSGSRQFLETQLIAVAMMFFLFTVTCCHAQSSIDTLYTLCRSDPVCATRYYLTPDSSTAYGRQLFERLLNMHLSQTLGVASIDFVPSLSSNSSIDTSNWWWLSLMKTARFCDGKANRIFQLGVGCRVADGKAHEDNDPSAFTFQFVTVDIIAAMAIIAVAYYTCFASEQLSQNKQAINNFMLRYAPPPPSVQPQSGIVISMPVGGLTAPNNNF